MFLNLQTGIITWNNLTTVKHGFYLGVHLKKTWRSSKDSKILSLFSHEHEFNEEST